MLVKTLDVEENRDVKTRQGPSNKSGGCAADDVLLNLAPAPISPRLYYTGNLGMLDNDWHKRGIERDHRCISSNSPGRPHLPDSHKLSLLYQTPAPFHQTGFEVQVYTEDAVPPFHLCRTIQTGHTDCEESGQSPRDLL